MRELKNLRTLDDLKCAILEEYNATKTTDHEDDIITEVVQNLTFYLDDTINMYQIMHQNHLIEPLGLICNYEDFTIEDEEKFMNKVCDRLNRLVYMVIEGPRIKQAVDSLLQKNPEYLEVVQTSEWYRESLDKCCSFEGHLKNQPEIEVEVIIGWKDPKTWKPIYKTHQNSLSGTIFKVHNDNPYRPFYSPSGTAILMNTDTVESINALESAPPLTAKTVMGSAPDKIEISSEMEM